MEVPHPRLVLGQDQLVLPLVDQPARLRPLQRVRHHTHRLLHLRHGVRQHRHLPVVQNVQMTLLLLPRLAVYLNRTLLQQLDVNMLAASDDVRRAESRLTVTTRRHSHSRRRVVQDVLEPDHFQQPVATAEIVVISAQRQSTASIVRDIQTRDIDRIAHVVLLTVDKQSHAVLQHRRTRLDRLAAAHDGVPHAVDHL